MSPLIYLTLWKNTHLEIKLTVLKKIRLIKSNSSKRGLWNKFIFADPPIILQWGVGGNTGGNLNLFWHSEFMTPLPLSSTNEWFDLKYFMECLSIFHYLFYIMSNLSYQVCFRSYHVIDASPLLVDTIRIYIFI